MGKGNPFFHTIPGTTVETGNVLVKIVKRKRKRARIQGDEKEGVFKLEAMGVMEKTVRFRGVFFSFHSKKVLN